MPDNLLDPAYVRGEMTAWKDMLATYVPLAKHSPPSSTILNVGCGIPYEVVPLLNFFGTKETPAQFIGIDTHPAAIETAQHIYHPHLKIEFHQADGRNITRIVREPADVVVHSNTQIRKPFCIGEWDFAMEETIRTVAGMHRQGGLLFMTFFSQLESERALESCLESYDVRFTGQNAYSNPSSTKPRHQHLILAVKR